MLDLQKYTKMCQVADHIKALESMDMDKVPKTYAQMLKRYQTQYDKLKEELFKNKNLGIIINLKAYISKCLEILNRNIADGQPKWQYYFDEVKAHERIIPDFYGDHIYTDYVYQVMFVCGDKEMNFCTLNRKLHYDDRDTINFVFDTIHAPFNLRLDEAFDEFDEETLKQLKLAPFKVAYEQKRNKLTEEMTLIQRRIHELQTQYNDKHDEYLDTIEQLENLDKEEIIKTK